MPYHDPFQHHHLFDLGPPPSGPSGPSRSRNPYAPPPRSLHAHGPSPDRGIPLGAGPVPPPRRQTETRSAQDDVAGSWFANTSAKRVNTDIYIYQALKCANPTAEVLDTSAFQVNILGYVTSTGDGEIETLSEEAKLSNLLDANLKFSSGHVPAGRTTNSAKPGLPDSMSQVYYLPPYRRLDGGKGVIATDPLFEQFLVKWHGHEFKVYIVDCRDGVEPFLEKRQYIITVEPEAALTLVQTAGAWQSILHNEIWVFDQGWWQKDPALYAAVQKSDWRDIILPEDLKEDLLKTVLRFYDSRDTYSRLRVPWKRGLIFYGPPGNGKTVSIKATMKTLLDRKKESIPTLYVKSLSSFAGPEYSVSMIFGKARQQAPCYLVFEDLDSLVGDEIRSFFLNAVDGLSENEGILMVGSTNHLERLDPGIAKRPSRFDRKYLFPDPAMKERKRYCQYWQKKLKDNDEVKFPDKLLEPIASLMDKFSFAYMQEAFVSTLLKIANDEQGSIKADEQWDWIDGAEELEVVGKDKGGDDDELDKYVLWREIKVQIGNLRKELNEGQED